MNYKNIVCIDDFIRKEFEKAKAFIYNLIREPILQATALDIGTSARFNNNQHNLCKNFKVDIFLSLLDSPSWESNYFNISEKAEKYLINNIPKKSLIISYEMPKWLEKILIKYNYDFIDIRISPLRFARDLYIVLHSNNNKLLKRIRKYEVKEEEVKLEASLVSSFARNKEEPNLDDNNIIFIGQTENDASLVNEYGKFVRISDFNIKEYSNNEKIYYLKHPLTTDHTKYEIDELSKFYIVEVIDFNVYNLLSAHKNFKFISISSSVIQESKYFEKESSFLYRPICPLYEKNYIQIHFFHFLEPIFWHKVLKVKYTKPILDKLPNIQSDWLRSLHNVWWGYAGFKKQNSYIDKVAFNISGGDEIREKIESLFNCR